MTRLPAAPVGHLPPVLHWLYDDIGTEPASAAETVAPPRDPSCWRPERTLSQRLGHALLVLLGALASTAACLLALPVLERIGEGPAADRIALAMHAIAPPEAPLCEKMPDPTPDGEPPPLLESDSNTALLDLSELELALQPLGAGSGVLPDVVRRLLGAAGAGEPHNDTREFSLAELDQAPRPVHQPTPVLTPELRKLLPAAVQILFVVDESGSVTDARVVRAEPPLFAAPALAAVRRWRFSPGLRNGTPVRFRMRVPITFPAN